MGNNGGKQDFRTKENKVDDAKVQAIARYIYRVLKENKVVDSEDYVALFAEEIARKYDNIMSSSSYNFENLESVKSLLGKRRLDSFTLRLYLSINEDSVIYKDPLYPDVVYGTPEYLKAEYEKTMVRVKRLHDANAFTDRTLPIKTMNYWKRALRRCIQETCVEGIDISIPQVEVNHDMINMIVDAIMQQYGKKFKDNIRSRMVSKLETHWSEIMTEQQCIDIEDFFRDEMGEFGYLADIPILYVKRDFVFLSNHFEDNSRCIYATPEALRRNVAELDKKIANMSQIDLIIGKEQKKRTVLVNYANANGIELDLSDNSRAVNEPQLNISSGGSITKAVSRKPIEREEI